MYIAQVIQADYKVNSPYSLVKYQTRNWKGKKDHMHAID